MIASLLAITDPGDEVIVFEPFYENYHPDTLLCSAVRKLVKLRCQRTGGSTPTSFAAFSSRTKNVIVNTPNNPTGKVCSSIT